MAPPANQRVREDIEDLKTGPEAFRTGLAGTGKVESGWWSTACQLERRMGLMGSDGDVLGHSGWIPTRRAGASRQNLPQRLMPPASQMKGTSRKTTTRAPSFTVSQYLTGSSWVSWLSWVAFIHCICGPCPRLASYWYETVVVGLPSLVGVSKQGPSQDCLRSKWKEMPQTCASRGILTKALVTSGATTVSVEAETDALS